MTCQIAPLGPNNGYLSCACWGYLTLARRAVLVPEIEALLWLASPERGWRPSTIALPERAAASPFPGRRSPPVFASKRIHHPEKRETVKIGVPGADSADSVLTHRNGRVHLMHLVAANIG